MRAGAREFARFVAIKETVARVARLLSKEAIEVAPLKGALLIVGYRREPTMRAVGDIDLLVPSARFEQATALLEKEGASVLGSSPDGRAISFGLPGSIFEIDLHQRLFRSSLYRLDEGALLARSTLDSEAFGEPVRLLSNEDALAHLIGHHAGGRPLDSLERFCLDLETLAPRVDLEEAATRLKEAGLLRALLFASLRLERNGKRNELIDSLLLRVPTSAADRNVAALAERASRAPAKLGSLARHLTNEDLEEAARSLSLHIAHSLVAATEKIGLSRDRRPSRGRR